MYKDIYPPTNHLCLLLQDSVWIRLSKIHLYTGRRNVRKGVYPKVSGLSRKRNIGLQQ
jgi:hypothetical protein